MSKSLVFFDLLLTRVFFLVPALFSSFRHLYTRGPQFSADIDALLESYVSGLKADGKLPGEGNKQVNIKKRSRKKRE